MAENRTPRDLVTREKTARVVYTPPSMLPDPTPEPGWNFRWIATSINGQTYAQNVAMRMREGWVPVKAEDHPELMIPGNASGNVEIGGLLLCKQPTETVQARNAYYNDQASKQEQSVDNTLMRQSDARMPLFRERQSKVSFGRGT